MKVQVRFNTNYFANKNAKKWRFIIDGEQHFVNQIICSEKSKTTTDIIIENGIELQKFHLTINSDSVEIKDEIAYVNGDFNEKLELHTSLSWSVKNNAWKIEAEEKEYFALDVTLLCGFYTCEKDGKFFICCNPGHIWFDDTKTKILLK